MHCSSCAMTIDFDLEDIDGVKSSKTSYARQECSIEFEEGKITIDQLVETVKKTGYSAIPLET